MALVVQTRRLRHLRPESPEAESPEAESPRLSHGHLGRDLTLRHLRPEIWPVPGDSWLPVKTEFTGKSLGRGWSYWQSG